jgi:hypothetical protein
LSLILLDLYVNDESIASSKKFNNFNESISNTLAGIFLNTSGF